MSDVSSSGEQPAPTVRMSWRAFARQLWLGAAPVLLIGLVLAAGSYGWRVYKVRSAKARDRQVYEELQSLFVLIQDARENTPPDFTALRGKLQAIGTSIPDAMKRDTGPGLPARQLLVRAVQDDLPQLLQGDLSGVSEAEVELARKLVQAAEWLEVPAPPLRAHPHQVAEALARIELFGGKVISDPSRPIQPVIAIELKGERFQDRHLEHLPNITSLTIESTEVTDAGLQSVARLRSLTTLHLACPKITDAGVEQLAALPGLSDVQLDHCTGITDSGLLAFKQARRLALFGSHVTNHTLAVLKDFPHLDHLTLRSDSLSEEGMGFLAECPGLTKLILSHCHELTDEALVRIAEMQSLETLGILGVDLTDAGLVSVGTLPRLTNLMILPCNERMRLGLRITDAGLKRMKNLENLQTLSIESCPGLTDASVSLLSEMPALTKLQLRETGITEDGHLQIVSSRPQTRVDFVLTPPSPLEGTPTAETAGNTPHGSAAMACKAWPVPDPQASLDATLTVEDLESEYRNDRQATDTKYDGKWVELSGVVSHTGNNLEGDPIIEFQGSNRRFEINCVLRSASDLAGVEEGETCQLRGVYCTSVLPTLLHCTVNGSAEGPLTDRPEDADSNREPDRGPPDVTLTAEELEAEVKADVREAQRKYSGKRLQVTGRLARIAHVISGAMVYRLGAPLTTQFFLRTGSPWCCARPGQTVTLVGRWFDSYPCLVDCEVIHVTGPADRIMPATALGQYLDADRARFRKWFYFKQLVVTGEVIEKSAPEEYPDQVTLKLRATSNTSVVCDMEIDEFRATESVRVGDSVIITGWNTRETPTDNVELVGCLFWRGR